MKIDYTITYVPSDESSLRFFTKPLVFSKNSWMNQASTVNSTPAKPRSRLRLTHSES